MSFEELGLREEVIRGVQDLGFTQPTEIQEKAIPLLINDMTDFVGLAQTGTGKTAAFGLPMLDYVDFSKKHIQGLVIAPTRELCLQIAKDIEAFSKHIKDVNIVSVYGGASISDQIRKVKKGAQIICATPGRLQDMIERKVVKLGDVDMVILDEADEMLNMGFKEDIFNILSFTPDTKKVWMFSATMPNEVLKIRKQFMTDPVEVQVGKRNQAASTVDHYYFMVDYNSKYEALKRLLDFHPSIFGVVFCRTKRDTASVAEKLMKDGYNAEPLHGDLTQQQRDRVMNLFRSRTLNILVATDVAARGIDVEDVTHVIHYGVPDDKEAYNHRSGRTGRAGKRGTSLAIIGKRDQRKLNEIERMIDKKIEKAEVPQAKEICDNQLIYKMNQIREMEMDDELIAPYMDQIMEVFQGYRWEDLLKKIVASELKTLLEYYQGSKDINLKQKSRDRDRGEKGRDRDKKSGEKNEKRERGEADSNRLFFNVGKLDGAKKGDIFKLIMDGAKVRKNDITEVRLMDKFSFVGLKGDVGKKIIDRLAGKNAFGRKLNVEFASKKR